MDVPKVNDIFLKAACGGEQDSNGKVLIIQKNALNVAIEVIADM